MMGLLWPLEIKESQLTMSEIKLLWDPKEVMLQHFSFQVQIAPPQRIQMNLTLLWQC